MKSKDLFNLAIRILGLVFLYQGLSSLPTVVVLAALSNGSGNLIMFVLMVIWQMLLAYWLLRGAPFIMNIAYPESSVTPTRQHGFKLCLREISMVSHTSFGFIQG